MNSYELRWKNFTNDLNKIRSVYKCERHHDQITTYSIIRQGKNKTDFVKIYTDNFKYFKIKTNVDNVCFNSRSNWDTKDLTKKFHLKCDELLEELEAKFLIDEAAEYTDWIDVDYSYMEEKDIEVKN